jgi:hypothetical protein
MRTGGMRTKRYSHSKYASVNKYLDKRRLSDASRYSYAKIIDQYVDWILSHEEAPEEEEDGDCENGPPAWMEDMWSR